MDFTLTNYITLLKALSDQGFSFLPFNKYPDFSTRKIIILRQDVDKLPENSLQFARIQREKGIKATYYFRTVPESFNEKIVKEIYELGHEIGYHYEDLSFAQAKLRAQGTGHRAQGEDLEKLIVSIGIESFKKNLNQLREIVPINTICMHGSPMSRWDSRLLWKYYDYHDFGIVGEPYFDIDFDEVLYLTDTGRRWNGDSVNIRDKTINHKGHKEDTKDAKREIRPATSKPPCEIAQSERSSLISQGKQPATFPKFHTTFDIIHAAEEGRLPDKIMMTFHPQRWTDKPVPWVKELVWQNVKNVGKYFLIRLRAEG
jgi:hypothetical protein